MRFSKALEDLVNAYASSDDDDEPQRAATQGRTMAHFAADIDYVTVPGDEVPALAPYMERGRHLLIDASYSAKKSYRIREVIEAAVKENPDVRILATSVRIIHAIDYKSQVAQYGFKSYKDIVKQRDVDLAAEPRLIISLESMHKLVKRSNTQSLPRYDILIVDEARSLCSVFTKTDMHNRDTSLYMFKQLLQTTPNCIFADADMSFDNAVTDMVRGITPDRPLRYLKVEKQRLKRHLRMYFTQDTLLEKQSQTDLRFWEQIVRPAIRHAIVHNERIAFACASKRTHADRLAMICRDEGLTSGETYQFYTSKTDDHRKAKHFEKPDDAFEGLFVIGATCSMTVAVDPRRTVISKIFLMTKKCYAGFIRDLFQQLGRWNRQPELHDQVLEVVCFIDDTHPDLLPSLLKNDAIEARKGGKSLPDPPTFERCLHHVRVEEQEQHDAFVRNHELEGLSNALLQTFQEHRNPEWVSRIQAATKLEEARMRTRAEHLKLVLHCAALRGWTHEYVHLDRALDSADLVQESQGSRPADIDEADADAVYAQARAYIDAHPEWSTYSAKEFFDSKAFGLRAQREGGHDLTASEKAVLDVYFALRKYRTFDVVVPNGERPFRKYASSFYQSRVEFRSKCRVYDVANERHSDMMRMKEGKGGFRIQNALRIEAMNSLLGLLGIEETMVTERFVPLSKDWSVTVRTYDPTGAHKELDNALLAIEKDLGVKNRCAMLAKRVNNLLGRVGIKMKRKRLKNKEDMYTLESDPVIMQMSDDFMMWHATAGAYVKTSEWDIFDDDMKEYYSDIQSIAAYYRDNVFEIMNSVAPSFEPLPVNGPFYEELLDMAALIKHVGSSTNEMERQYMETIHRNCVPSTLEPGKSCLRTVYGKKGLYGREWANYPSMGYVSQRVRAIACLAYYWDLDMIKCHAMICLNIAEMEKLLLAALQEYVAAPDKVLAELAVYYMGKDTPANRRQCKMLVNSVLNRGTTGGWVCKIQEEELKRNGLFPRVAKKMIKYGGEVKECVRQWVGDFNLGKAIMDKVERDGDHPLIAGFHRNIKTLHGAMKRRYPDIFAHTRETIRISHALSKEYPTEEAIERKAFSDCLFEVEHQLLIAIIKSLQGRGFRVDAKIHDGCNVRRKDGMDTLPEDVISGVEADVLQETGFKVRLKVKPFEITGPPAQIVPSEEVAHLNKIMDEGGSARDTQPGSADDIAGFLHEPPASDDSSVSVKKRPRDTQTKLRFEPAAAEGSPRRIKMQRR